MNAREELELLKFAHEKGLRKDQWSLCVPCLLYATAILPQYHRTPVVGDKIEIVTTDDGQCETDHIRVGALGFPGVEIVS